MFFGQFFSVDSATAIVIGSGDSILLFLRFISVRAKKAIVVNRGSMYVFFFSAVSVFGCGIFNSFELSSICGKVIGQKKNMWWGVSSHGQKGQYAGLPASLKKEYERNCPGMGCAALLPCRQ